MVGILFRVLESEYVYFFLSSKQQNNVDQTIWKRTLIASVAVRIRHTGFWLTTGNVDKITDGTTDLKLLKST